MDYGIEIKDMTGIDERVCSLFALHESSLDYFEANLDLIEEKQKNLMDLFNLKIYELKRENKALWLMINGLCIKTDTTKTLEEVRNNLLKTFMREADKCPYKE